MEPGSRLIACGNTVRGGGTICGACVLTTSSQIGDPSLVADPTSVYLLKDIASVYCYGNHNCLGLTELLGPCVFLLLWTILVN